MLVTKPTRLGNLEFLENDSCIGKSLSTYGEWAENEIQFLRGLVNEGDIVLDVGANIGTHTCSFVTMVGKTGKVYAFEAQRFLYDILRRNCANLHPSAEVVLLHAIVSSHKGQVTEEQVDYKENRNFGAISFTATSNNALDAGESIAQITIDSLDLEKCDLIKIDVEGMESAVLQGALETIRRQRPLLFFECNDLQAGWESLTILNEVDGYKYFIHSSSPYNPDNFNEVSENIFFDYMESNIIAVPNGHPAVSYIEDRAVPVDGLNAFIKEILRQPRSLDHPLEIFKLSISHEDAGKVISDQAASLNEAAELAISRLNENEVLSARLVETDEALNETKELAVSRMKENEVLSARLVETDEALNETKELAVSRMKENESLSARFSEVQRALKEINQVMVVEKTQTAKWKKQAEAVQESIRKMRATPVWRLARAAHLVKDD